MVRRVMILLVLGLLAHGVQSSRAQDCTVAIYGDPEGTRSLGATFDGEFFSLYVVMHVESAVAAASYKLQMDGLGTEVFIQARIPGPRGEGLVIDEPTGTNVALTECLLGFGGSPVLIEQYVLYPTSFYVGGTARIVANVTQGPMPVYATCTDELRPCDVGPTWVVEPVVASTANSFGAIKALFVR